MRKPWLILLIISVLVLSYSIYNVYTMPDMIQVQTISPNIESIDLDIKYATDMYIESASVSSKENSTGVDIHAVNNAYFNLNYLKLLDGRFFYPNESDDVVILDYETSLKLLPSISPVGSIVKLNDKYFTVIGIVKKAPYSRYIQNVFIPIKSSVKNKFKGKILTYAIDIKKDSRSEFLSSVKGDNTWELRKEKERSVLLLKFIIYLAIMALAGFLRRKLTKYVKKLYYNLLDLNTKIYPRQFIPQILYFIFIIIIGYALFILVYAIALRFIVNSIITFPEYIPEILVDFKLIYETYVSNIKKSASLFITKTDIITLVEYYSGLINTFTMLALFSVCTLILKEKKHDKKDS